MRVLIIDDSGLWIKQGKDLLEKGGHIVTGIIVSDPQQFASELLPEPVVEALKKADVLLVDKDFGESVTSTRLICVVRHNFSKLPIIRWTGGYEDTPYMKYLGVSCMGKPTKRNEAEFTKEFGEKFQEQKLILSDPMEIFAKLDETVEPSEYAIKNKILRLDEIEEIAKLGDQETAWHVWPDGSTQWGTTGKNSGPTKHELGHCICDGVLTADEISPYLPALQKVIAKLEAAGEIDERFKICAEFIKSGKLEELELVKGCY